MKAAITLLVLGVAGFAVATLVHPSSTGLAVDVLVLYAGAILLIWLVARLHAFAPAEERSIVAAALDRPPAAPKRPDELKRLERRIALGVANAGDHHATLAPHLREIAAPLLDVQGVDAERDPDAARAYLGDPAWKALRYGLDRPREPFAPGMPVDELEAAVEALEALVR